MSGCVLHGPCLLLSRLKILGYLVEHCLEFEKNDVGEIINPTMVDGQINGGLAQGIGEALLEHLIYDKDEQLLIGSFMDYALASAKDIPPVTIAKMTTPSPFNSLGAKGVGESGTIGFPVAFLKVAMDAFCSHGMKKLQMPLTCQNLWRLKDKKLKKDEIFET